MSTGTERMDAAVTIAEHVARLGYQDLPPEAVLATKKSILDTIGVILAASGLGEGCREIVGMVKDGGGKPEGTILAFGGKVPVWMAAFANGSMCHALDYDDIGDAAVVHPTAATLPAALALAERHGRVSGRDLITAIAAGNDVAMRMGLALTKNIVDYGWNSTQIFGLFGATTAASKILGLDAGRIVNAFAFAYNQAAGNLEVAFSTGSVIRSIRDAFTGKNGVLSALLAQRGLAGFATSLEGKVGLYNQYFHGDYQRGRLIEDLGRRFEGADVSFKPWPSCRGTHAALDGTLALVSEHNLAAEDIAEIVLTLGSHSHALCVPEEERRRPALGIDAKHSLPFNVALAVVRRKVVLDDFTPEAIRDPAILAIAEKVSAIFSPELSVRGIEAAIVELRCADGRVFTRRVDFPRGHPENPISTEELVAKFIDCASHSVRAFERPAADAVCEAILNLEEIDDLRPVITLLGN